jgi:hypothetical protein
MIGVMRGIKLSCNPIGAYVHITSSPCLACQYSATLFVSVITAIYTLGSP